MADSSSSTSESSNGTSAEPAAEIPDHSNHANGNGQGANKSSGSLRSFLRAVLGMRSDSSVRDALDELIENRDDAEIPIDEDERRLLANILEMRGRTVDDVMVPRADIVSIEVDTSMADLIDVITEAGHSRLPVYREALDDALGMIHVKDVLAWRKRDDAFNAEEIVRRVLFVSPSMQVLELMLEMRVSRCQMALVVDEYGGVDGLVTIEDLVEEIVGEIEDEFDKTREPKLTQSSDGSYVADARVRVEAIEAIFGALLSDDEREEIDTVGGLVFALAGRVPIRGEIVQHDTGLEFEIMDADPRQIHRLRIRTGVLFDPEHS